MLALGLAGCGAGGFNCRVDDLGVSLRGNLRLLDQHLVTDRAMLALGLAGCGAGGGDCRVDDLGMALGRDFFLGNEYSIADGAVLAFGQTSLSAGWSLCCIDYFCVAGRRDFFHTGENRITNGALRTGCMTSLGAGCRLLGNFNGSMTGSIDCFGFGLVADRAGVGLDTGIFTGRSGRDLALIPLVSRCGNFLHAGESLAADRAFFAGFMTSLGAGSGLFRNFNRSMSSCVDCFGLGCIANRAGVGLDAGILTGRRGRDLALIPTVTLGGNLFLRFDNRSADRAADAIRQTRFGAGRRLARNGLLGVAGRGNHFLRNENLVANRAVLAFGQTSLSAGWSLCCIDYFCVAGRRDFFHTGENRITNGALRTGCMTSLGAGCRLLGNFNGSMTGSIDCFGFGLVADRAGVGLDTGIFTGRSGRDLALIPLVSRCGNFLHAGESLAADRAFFAGFMTSLGAGSGLFRNFNRSMSSCVDCFGLGCIANRAGVGLDAGILTGRRGRDLALIPTVTLGGNLFLRFDNRSADRAADAIRQTRFGAGSRLAHNGLLCVAGRGDLGLCNENLVADGAVLALSLAGFGTGRLDPCVNDLSVSLRGYFLHAGESLATDRAFCAGFVSGLGAGCGLLGNFNGSMTGSRNNLTVSDLLIAVLAVGIAGISGLGASGGFRVADLGVLMCARRAAPYAFDIVDNIASLGSLRLGVGAVGVVQLGGGNGDGHRIIPVRIILIGCGRRAGCALLNIFAGSVAGADIRAALGGVDSADSRQATVYIHLGILQVCIGAVIGFTGCIRNRLELARTPDKVIGVPFIAVINVDIFSTGDRQVSTLGDAHLNTSQ